MWPWFMKFSTTILRITPFSAACSTTAAVFLPADFERLVALSSVAGDAEVGGRRFGALASLLHGASLLLAAPLDIPAAACTAYSTAENTRDGEGWVEERTRKTLR